MRKLQIALLGALIVLCSCSAMGGLFGDGADPRQRAISSIRLVNMDETCTIHEGLVSMNIVEEEDTLRVVLTITEDCTVDRLLYHLEYDYSLMHPISMEMQSLLSSGDTALEVVSDRLPGCIGLGQVSPSLVSVTQLADTHFGSVLFW